MSGTMSSRCCGRRILRTGGIADGRDDAKTHSDVCLVAAHTTSPPPLKGSCVRHGCGGRGAGGASPDPRALKHRAPHLLEAEPPTAWWRGGRDSDLPTGDPQTGGMGTHGDKATLQAAPQWAPVTPLAGGRRAEDVRVVAGHLPDGQVPPVRPAGGTRGRGLGCNVGCPQLSPPFDCAEGKRHPAEPLNPCCRSEGVIGHPPGKGGPWGGILFSRRPGRPGRPGGSGRRGSSRHTPAIGWGLGGATGMGRRGRFPGEPSQP